MFTMPAELLSCLANRNVLDKHSVISQERIWYQLFQIAQKPSQFVRKVSEQCGLGKEFFIL